MVRDKEWKLFLIFIYNAPNMVGRKIFPFRDGDDV
jgi:hypothetical protein